jgi:hypothetical protein
MSMDAFTFDVHGNGMGFTLDYGDKVRVLRAPIESFRTGDLFVFLSGWHGVDRTKRLAVHRLLFKTRGDSGWRLWAKSDASWRLDSPIPESCVLGKVAAISRDGGTSWRELDPPGNRMRHWGLGLASCVYFIWKKGQDLLASVKST